MSVETASVYRCNLCEWTSQPQKGSLIPKGWVKVNRAHGIHICKDCAISVIQSVSEGQNEEKFGWKAFEEKRS